MSHQVKTLVKGLSLPDGNLYPNINTVVTLTDDQFQQIDPQTFSRGYLQDLGPVTTANSTTTPTDIGYKTWSYDPIAAVNTQAPTGGILYLMRVQFRAADTISTIWMGTASVTGIALTAGQNFVGVYNSTGLLIGSSADISGQFATTGEKSFALTTATNVSAGFVWLALLMNGTTLPTFARGSAVITGLGNGATATTTKRFAQYGTAQTALPTQLTLSNLANTSSWAYWAAAS